jgi:hypothetical protein
LRAVRAALDRLALEINRVQAAVALVVRMAQAQRAAAQARVVRAVRVAAGPAAALRA